MQLNFEDEGTRFISAADNITLCFHPFYPSCTLEQPPTPHQLNPADFYNTPVREEQGPRPGRTSLL